MKHFILIISLALTASPLFGQQKSPEQKSPESKVDMNKVSYSIGLQIGLNLQKQEQSLKKQGTEINTDALINGLKDALAGKPQLTTDQVRSTLVAFEQDMTQKQQAVGEKNKADGEKFLAENKKKEGVKTTPSGLQYKVIKEGNGPQPKGTDTVVANYRGTLIDGTEFDSSYKRGQPATFPLNRVIKGWTEGLQLMKVGSKYQFFIPANLAYGSQQMGPDISPNSTLIFDVELVGIQPSPTPATASNPAASPSPR
ncbi:MAG TPA: FKBP-type peptidyl-prolyl cis-trans isomerase [Chthoniobacterales bacterium]|jgi:FKBP-type peptidyl-prolyl cis-trans isomerase FklB|nr:FKBP-type peptidyl-prolyl cis-trans isomerase [Chthoniobacterales bacterium]